MTIIQLPQHLQRSWDAVGGLSQPSKMPCYSWGLPAAACNIGSKLAKQEGTVCSTCYALKGRYKFRNVQTALQRRLDCYRALTPNQWASHMIDLLDTLEREPFGSGFFRWFDSGDLQDVEMLRAIAEIARGTPDIQHWLPTRERYVVKQLTRRQEPANLVIRVSTNFIDHLPRQEAPRHPQSAVVTDMTGVNCKAYNHDNQCGTCRDCWDPFIPLITYKLH